MCQLIHLQLVFAHNACESLKFYILNSLKKPNKMRIHHFVQCVMQLNIYIEELPCLFYSPSMSLQTQRVYSYTDPELECQILRMCPVKWQDQYQVLPQRCYAPSSDYRLHQGCASSGREASKHKAHEDAGL